MAGTITSLVVYDSVLFNRTGQVRRWAERVEAKFTENAKLAAPFNIRPRKSHLDEAYPPGSLIASISGDVDRVGPVHLQITASANVPYALYVLRGTRARITPDGDYMLVPRNPGFGASRNGTKGADRIKIVSGQQAQNFFEEAAFWTSRTHPSLRGFDDMLFREA